VSELNIIGNSEEKNYEELKLLFEEIYWKDIKCGDIILL
jgi:hypothetical protein